MSVDRRYASAAARSRQSRKSRLTRYTIFTMKRHYHFRVRKSLVEYVDEDLDDMGTSVFYQRIYIFAKNLPIGGRDKRMQELLQRERQLYQEQRQSIHSNNTNLTQATNASEDSEISEVNEVIPENRVSTASNRLSGNEAVTFNAVVDMEREEHFTKTYKFYEDKTIIAVADETTAELEVEEEEEPQEKSFYDLFMEKMDELKNYCMERVYTPDPMRGLFLYMGEYSMLMLESCEDLIGMFCNELEKCCGEFWESNRIFQIEDKIPETYFDDLIGRRIPAAFINEKFPPSTPTDEYLMGKQHLIIKHKLKTICGMISNQLHVEQAEDEEETEKSSSEEEKLKRFDRDLGSLLVPLDTYRKLLPEIQRIDLVLSSTRFYYTLDEFTKIYGTIPLGQDEDTYFWPIQNNYTPPNIFVRTPFDINLTFADYGKSMHEQKSETSIVSEQSVSGDAGNADGKSDAAHE